MEKLSTDGDLAQPMGAGDLCPSDSGRLDGLDYQIRMQKRYRYKDIKRNHDLEEKALKNTIECKTFKARLSPQVCMLRKMMYPYKACLDCKSSVST